MESKIKYKLTSVNVVETFETGNIFQDIFYECSLKNNLEIAMKIKDSKMLDVKQSGTIDELLTYYQL
tara:strand:+ start:801 stop:1001 length:201 start_codon:yes stop_codon:yes gene_type:complete